MSVFNGLLANQVYCLFCRTSEIIKSLILQLLYVDIKASLVSRKHAGLVPLVDIQR